MVRQRRIGGAAALAASMGAFALCTAAPSPTGGTPAPPPGAAPTPAPASAGGGTAAPEAGPPAPALRATAAQEVPLQEEGEDELELDVPPEPRRPERKTPDVPALRSMGAVESASAASLPQTGADAWALGAAGTFLIGVGLALLAPTLPVRRL